MESAEREPITGVCMEAEPTGPTPLPIPLKNSSDLYQFQERPQAKVGWTCPPQSTPWRRHWCHVPLKSSAHLNTKLVCVEPRPSALNMTLPAFAAERRRRIPATDRYLQQTATAAVDRRDRQTNGQPDRYIDPAPRPYYVAGSVKRMFCSVCFISCYAVEANYIQGGDADVSCTAWLRTTLLGVVIHMCRRHAAPTQAQVRLH